MRYWGWRPLVLSLWISVLVTACMTEHDLPATDSPTLRPTITLTLRRTTSPPTMTPPITAVVATPIGTSTPYPVADDAAVRAFWRRVRASLGLGTPSVTPLLVVRQFIDRLPLPTSLHPLSLTISPPICHLIVTDLLVCLGTVTNTQPVPVRQVALAVQAFDADGLLLAQAEAQPEQRILLPGMTAPYRALLRVDRNSHDVPVRSISVQLLSAVPDLSSQPVVLEVQVMRIEVVGGVTRATLAVSNPTADILRRGRVMLMLLGREGALAGYRVVELDALPPGAQPTLTLDILPHDVPLPYIVRAYGLAEP